MKINSTTINKAYGATQTAIETHRKQQPVIKSPINTDKIVMSQEAMDAQVVSKATKVIVEELNDDYANRIQQLKAAITNKTYQIDTDKIASAMVSHMGLLGDVGE